MFSSTFNLRPYFGRESTHMKKITLQILIGLFIVSCSSTKKFEHKTNEIQNKNTIYYDFAAKLNPEQLLFIKSNYNWNNKKVLIIKYRQPISYCHFDNNKITIGVEKWRKNVYSHKYADNCLIIEVLANGERVKKKLDNVNFFDDKNDFLLNSFFNRRKSCFGVLVVNNTGDYIQYNGHYSEKQVAKFVEILKK